MKHYDYNTSGTCSVRVSFDLEGETVHNLSFLGGCNGNLKAIGKLAEGRERGELIGLLKGNTCGYKPTSCADQFARALEKTLTEEA